MTSNFKMTLGAITVSMVLSGCAAVGPDYQQTSLDHLGVDNQVSGLSSVNIVDREKTWWRSFNNAQLNTLIAQALINNPTIEIAKANAAAAYGLFADIDNDNLPAGSVGLNYSAQDQVIIGTDPIVQQRANVRSYQVGADVSWNLDLFGKLQRASEAALADAESQYYAWQDAQVSIVAQVASSYAQLSGLQVRIDVAERNIQSLQKSQNLIQSRVDGGVASELDLLRIDAELKGVQASIPAFRSQASVIKNTLAAMVGYAPNALHLDMNKLEIPQLNQPIAIGDPKQLLRRRADLKQVERNLAAANARIGVMTASLYPDISVSGFVGFLSGNLVDLGSQTKAWSIAPSLSWPVFDFASVNAQIAVANANERVAFANFKKQVLDVLAEAQSALEQYTYVQQQQNLLQAQVEVSQRSLALVQLQYDAGTIDLLVLLDVERTLLNAQDQLAQTKAQTFDNIIEVYKSFGGGLNKQDLEATSVILAKINTD